MPEISATVAYLSGSIQRLSDSRFYAVIPGRRGCLTSYKTTQPDAAFRQAYNYLRRDAGLPKFPRLCSCCGQLPTHKQSHKCMACSAPKRNAAEHDKPRTSPASALKVETGNLVPTQRESQSAPSAVNAEVSAVKLIEARKRADEIIRQRGGKVPYNLSFEEYLYKWQASRR
jgi:hypothetical protein